MITKKDLESYAALRFENENRLEVLAMMDADRRREYEERIRPAIDTNKQEMSHIEAAVASLQDPREREVLRLRYLDGSGPRLQSWKTVALWVFGYNKRSHLEALRRIHNAALSHLEDLTG